MTHPLAANVAVRKYPFANMKISDNSLLSQVEGRSACSKCGKSRKFFCYTCCIPVADLKEKIPTVKLPVKIDIIKHKSEIDGKSSAVHAPILAPEDVRIFTYPDIPDYSKESGVVLIFPCAKSVTVNHLYNDSIQLSSEANFGLPKGYNMGTLLKSRLQETVLEGGKRDEEHFVSYGINDLPVKRAVFIDSTWNQSRGIYKDERIFSLKSVALQNRISQFWRHQRGSPRWYLATIEAIHQFLLEVHVNAWGLSKDYRGLDNLDICDAFYDSVRLLDTDDGDNIAPNAPYNGQYDNLLFFFSHMYDLIHIYYDHNELKSYKRPI